MPGKPYLSKNDAVFAVMIVVMIIYMAISSFSGCQREERIKSQLRTDSINTKALIDRIDKIDSVNLLEKKKDSILTIRSKSLKKKISITKKKYEENNLSFPVLPEF